MDNKKVNGCAITDRFRPITFWGLNIHHSSGYTTDSLHSSTFPNFQSLSYRIGRIVWQSHCLLVRTQNPTSATGMRKIYLVTEFEYHKYKDSKSVVKLMTWDLNEARLAGKKIFNSFDGKDNINETDTEETYYACFNYGCGAGTMTIEIEVVESEEDLKDACGANNLRSFLKANGFLLPKGFFPKPKYIS